MNNNEEIERIISDDDIKGLLKAIENGATPSKTKCNVKFAYPIDKNKVKNILDKVEDELVCPSMVPPWIYCNPPESKAADLYLDKFIEWHNSLRYGQRLRFIKENEIPADLKWKPFFEDHLHIGIDIHGVIDTNPLIWKLLINSLRAQGHKVHILTGAFYNSVETLLVDNNIEYDYFYSINQTFIDNKVEIIGYDKNDKSRPIFNTKIWNNAKGEYCKKNGIDIMFDDTKIYKDNMPNSTIFNHVI